MFRWHERNAAPRTSEPIPRYGVQWAITDRFGGHSVGALAELNLGSRAGDAADAMQRNRSIMAREFGLEPGSVKYMAQQHGTQVSVVDAESSADPPRCDAIISSDPQVALAVLVADCTPVLLVDRAAGWVAAVHAGRAGMIDGVVSRCIDELRDRGALSLEAIVGPSICGRCYEVPEHMRDTASQRFPACHAVSWVGTPAIDVAAGVVAQLCAEGVTVRWLPGCTRESADLYSHRQDRHTGRFAGVVRLTELLDQ